MLLIVNEYGIYDTYYKAGKKKRKDFPQVGVQNAFRTPRRQAMRALKYSECLDEEHQKGK